MDKRLIVTGVLIFFLGMLTSYLPALAFPGKPNPGHSASEIGAGTFGEAGDYVFPAGSRVGIGTAPSYNLDVAGDIRWTGTLQGGSIPWARLTNFPSACPAGQYLTGIESTGLICNTTPSGFPYSPGLYVLAAADTERSTDSTSYTLAKRIVLGERGGTLRISFEMMCKTSGGGNCGAVYPGYARIYRNGQPVGTERVWWQNWYFQYDEVISGWSPGDSVELYYRVGGTELGRMVYVRNFKISVYPPSPVVDVD